MVRCLIEEGASPSLVDARGMTPLAHAAHGGNLLAVRVLLKAKAVGATGRSVVERVLIGTGVSGFTGCVHLSRG